MMEKKRELFGINIINLTTTAETILYHSPMTSEKCCTNALNKTIMNTNLISSEKPCFVRIFKIHISFDGCTKSGFPIMLSLETLETFDTFSTLTFL